MALNSAKKLVELLFCVKSGNYLINSTTFFHVIACPRLET